MSTEQVSRSYAISSSVLRRRKQKALEAFYRLLGRARGSAILLSDYKAIYYPVPKAACSSMKKVCADLLGIVEHEETNVHEIWFPTVRRKNLDKFQDHFKFTVVRNPWDRLVSSFTNKIGKDSSVSNRYFVNGVARTLAKYGRFYAGMPFAEYAEQVIGMSDREADPHFRSQHLFLPEADGELLIDYVAKLETLHQDYETISNRIGLPDIPLPHRLKSKKQDYRRFFDGSDGLASAVEQRYKRDVELFGYRFGE